MLQNQHEGLMSLMNDDASIVTKISEVKEQLGKVEHHLGRIKEDIGTLDAFLDKVVACLDKPSELLQVSTITFSLDRLNRLVQENAAKQADRISLAEVAFGDNEKRVGVLASFPRKELVSIVKPGSISLA
jgi:septal ring factor EnvC (AmiA/AmiB activator)